jgi:DNA-binding response OmpR family regulator
VEEGVMRVLVADDDPDIRALVTIKLKRSGFDVIDVGDGQAALDGVREQPPDLVIVDLMMPKMSGIEVCQALRADPATAGIPVIMLTARAQESDVARGFAQGADDYIIKPFSPRELASRVQAVMARVRK